MIETASAYDYDIVIIGAGPGGYETAIKAAQLGKKTCVVERAYFGGTCLNVGCIPTKTLIKTAGLLKDIRSAEMFAIEGIDPAKVSVNMAKLQQRKNTIVKQLSNGVKGLLRGNKVDILEGSASFLDHHTILAGDKKITSETFIIATGSSVYMPPFIKLQGKTNVITSTEALDLDVVPPSVAIIGGGVIGIEFAYMFSRLGSRVTVLELMENILPMVDAEISAMVQKQLEKEGVSFQLGARVSAVEDDTILYTMNDEDCRVQADTVLMAVGRIPNTDGLNAEGIGIEFDGKAIKTDSRMRTNIPNIYAIGDVNGKTMLAHTASHEGMVAISDLCGGGAKIDYNSIPSCIYTEPEVASIGLTESQAREKYADNIKVGRFNMAANGKSLLEGDTAGLFKVIVEKELGEILGVHLYGKHATEMIGGVSVAMTAEATAEEIINAVHPHPTVNEALAEAFRDAWSGKAINSL